MNSDAIETESMRDGVANRRNPVRHEVWRIKDIDHIFNMVALTSLATPTVKRFGVPSPIDRAEVAGDQLQVHCAGGVVWAIRISDGSRRKLKPGQG